LTLTIWIVIKCTCDSFKNGGHPLNFLGGDPKLTVVLGPVLRGKTFGARAFRAVPFLGIRKLAASIAPGI
jgi:hypothetical protein